MSFLRLPALTLLAGITGVAGVAAQKPVMSIKEQILEFERLACLAYQHNDARAIDSLLAPDEIMTDSHGVLVPRTEDVSDARNGTAIYTDFHNEDQTVHIYGTTTAVVRGKTIVKGKMKTGEPVDIVVQFTDVIVRIDGRWRLVSGHISRLKPVSS